MNHHQRNCCQRQRAMVQEGVAQSLKESKPGEPDKERHSCSYVAQRDSSVAYRGADEKISMHDEKATAQSSDDYVNTLEQELSLGVLEQASFHNHQDSRGTDEKELKKPGDIS